MKSSYSSDILIQNVSILPGADPAEFMERGWILIRDSRIDGIGLGDPPESSPREIIDGSGCLAIPGLINAHTHAAMALFRGLADDLPLDVWLQEKIFPAEKKWVREEFVYRGTLLACAEMIRGGTTTFADGYFFEEQAARAVAQAGMRALLGQGVLDFPTPDSPTPAEGLKRAESFIRRFAGAPLIRPAIFPHSVYTCSPDLLHKCHELAARYKVPVMIHVAEAKAEVEELYLGYGATPVAFLEEQGLLSSNLVACHCVWLSAKEMDLLARHEVKVVHNPESNMKLASGVAPLPELLARGITVGLGTDGCASNNNLDLFQEMGAAARLHKVHRLDPTAMPAAAVFEMATLAGARVLGLEDEIGSLEVGKKADVVVLDLKHPHLQPVYNVLSHIVYSAAGPDVRDVIIDGRPVMRRRRLLTLDEEEILSQAREWGARIRGAGRHDILGI